MLELLSPAGSMEALRAAVQNGANAVYLGIGTFNARQGAKNFTLETLGEALKYCHIRGVAVHLTLNTLVSDREFKSVSDLIRRTAEAGVDAFIVQDLGVAQLCRQIAPEVPVHGSTQLTVHSLPGVMLCAALGMKRVVLSRELNREEIRYICKNSPIEIEIFGHGALCMCYSGQCYLSAMIGGRSGNRGRCAQPCRQSYGYGRWESRYPLSLKDNCLVHYVKELEEMGVASLKLEGRMKRPEYVATVTGVYRKAIDEGQVTPEMMDALYTAFNRQGFTNGYYTNRIDLKMFGTREDTRDDPRWLQQARQTYESGETSLVNIQFQCAVTVDGCSLAVIDPEGRRCSINGPRPELAQNVPLSGQVLSQWLSKTGGTPYRCTEIRTHIDPGLTVPASAVNAMRREVLNQLTAIRARVAERTIRAPKPVPNYRSSTKQPGLTIQVTTREQLTQTLVNTESAMLYVPINVLMEDEALCQALGRRGRVAAVLPRIVHDGELPKLRDAMGKLLQYGIRDVLIGNYGLVIPAKEAGMRIHGDFSLNVYNSATANLLQQMDIASLCLSFEMTLPQIRDVSKAIPSEIFAYGRLPLMVTEHCLIRNKTGECTCNAAPTKLTDRTGADFPIIKDCGNCRSVLLNGKKLNWLDRQNDLGRLGLWAVRLYFTTENAREVERVLSDYVNPVPFEPGFCTRGLYLRGLE